MSTPGAGGSPRLYGRHAAKRYGDHPAGGGQCGHGEAIGESLAGLGYRVFSAATGAEALALFDAQGQGIDLVLLATW
ncbi:MAG: hypothetical protein IPO15_27380 [Anaerolineae bacterium]|uniref:hypothetical protein n=1 Tax=Candidatus Amarolinea dominans TaxID=3140696 RepID=UPI003135F147|nr:hypothetical protein [Anaerolineae bacterium]